MSLSQEISQGILSVSRILRGIPDSAQPVPADHDVAWRSFVAVLVCLPLAFVLGGLQWNYFDPEGKIGLPVYFSIVVVGHVLAWFGYALLSLQLAIAMGAQKYWLRYIVLWNWLNLFQFLVLLAGGLPEQMGLPVQVETLLDVAMVVAVLFMSWRIAAEGLGIPGVRAAAFIGLEMIVSLFISSVTQTILKAAVQAAT